MDEAGRGPAIGPIVFGLVIATPDQLDTLREAGVDDSKKLSKKKREEFHDIITETVSVYDTLAVDAVEIDHLRDSITMNQIEVKKFRELVQPYVKNIDLLQLDAADVNAVRFGRQFNDLIDGEIDSRHKGDSIFVAVGAASILAKLERDRLVEELQQQITDTDSSLPSFGSGYPAQAKPFLEAYVKKYGELPDFARKSWKTSKDALYRFKEKKTEQQSLADFS